MATLLGLEAAEQWAPIVSYEGYYEVSDFGRVCSIDRIVKFSDGRSRRCAERIRGQATLQSGHKTVALCRDLEQLRSECYAKIMIGVAA